MDMHKFQLVVIALMLLGRVNCQASVGNNSWSDYAKRKSYEAYEYSCEKINDWNAWLHIKACNYADGIKNLGVWASEYGWISKCFKSTT
jgi:hypothetical protein